MLTIGSFLILVQLLCVKSNDQVDQVDPIIKIVKTRAADVPLVNPDAFINGLFTKLANAESSEKVVTSSYKNHGFETSETSGKFQAGYALNQKLN